MFIVSITSKRYLQQYHLLTKFLIGCLEPLMEFSINNLPSQNIAFFYSVFKIVLIHKEGDMLLESVTKQSTAESVLIKGLIVCPYLDFFFHFG